jgi:Chromo (CHRromatin Organisation MOdifier) domain
MYLKLQPYRQTSVQRRENHKLSSKYYGPFEILEKIGKLAYMLNLSEDTQIHLVFHISQLKEKLDHKVVPTTNMSLVGKYGQMKVEPVVVLDRQLVKKGNELRTQILVRWSNLSNSDATWEDYLQIQQ